MTGRRRFLIALVVVAALASGQVHFAAPAPGVPERLSNAEFWRLLAEFSESAGFFNSDNLVSNEDTFQSVVPELVRTVAPGGAYLGVGPDQNFTYIAAVDPAVAFIPDLRRGNLQLHLMYKALFALSADRREFLSRLFARPVPDQLSPDASAAELMRAFRGASADRAIFQANLRAVLEYLTRHKAEALGEDDEAGIAYVLDNFFASGPGLTFVSNRGFRRGSRYPSYAALQAATDLDGVERAYLSSEPLFQRVKGLQERNLVIPVVGNFSGARALQAIGGWLRGHGAVVTTFYTSNVEQYLFQEGGWDRFRRNLATMPVDASSTFIRACFNSCSSPGASRAVSLLDSIPGLLEAAAAGRIRAYWDVLTHSRSPE